MTLSCPTSHPCVRDTLHMQAKYVLGGYPYVSHWYQPVAFRRTDRQRVPPRQHIPSHPPILVVKVLMITPVTLGQKTKEAVELSQDLKSEQQEQMIYCLEGPCYQKWKSLPVKHGQSH